MKKTIIASILGLMSMNASASFDPSHYYVNDDSSPELSEFELSKSKLSDHELSESRLSEPTLRETTLRETTLSKSALNKSRSGVSQINVSYAFYQLDELPVNYNSSGLMVSYSYRHTDTGIGLNISSEKLVGGDIEASLRDVGLSFDLPLGLEGVKVTPDIGIFRGSVMGSSDVSYYVGASISADLIPDKLIASVYYKQYDFTYDEFWDTDRYGLKLSYNIDSKKSLELGFNNIGSISSYTIGLGFKF